MNWNINLAVVSLFNVLYMKIKIDWLKKIISFPNVKGTQDLFCFKHSLHILINIEIWTITKCINIFFLCIGWIW